MEPSKYDELVEEIKANGWIVTNQGSPTNVTFQTSRMMDVGVVMEQLPYRHWNIKTKDGFQFTATRKNA